MKYFKGIIYAITLCYSIYLWLYYYYNSRICKDSLYDYKNYDFGAHQKTEIAEIVKSLEKAIPLYDSFVEELIWIVLFLLVLGVVLFYEKKKD